MQSLSDAVDARIAFTTAFRLHPAGVAIVAAETSEGLAGLTVSSLASVSVDPFAVSFSVTSSRGSAGAVLGADTIGISLLDARHVDVADAFARPGAPRFTTNQGWTSFESGEPILRDAHAALCCVIVETIAVGSSTLVVAEVLETRLGSSTQPPMVYRDRAFHGLT